tara:strand:+ start:581 stop:850 length:270 start_codon:yes stop_codon:yes gene_type:complete
VIRLGVTSSTVILTVSIVLGGFIGKLSGGIFEYIQSLYAFFVTPFATVFILGMLWRRINGIGALLKVLSGFALRIAIKLYLNFGSKSPA